MTEQEKQEIASMVLQEVAAELRSNYFWRELGDALAYRAQKLRDAAGETSK